MARKKKKKINLEIPVKNKVLKVRTRHMPTKVHDAPNSDKKKYSRKKNKKVEAED